MEQYLTEKKQVNSFYYIPSMLITSENIDSEAVQSFGLWALVPGANDRRRGKIMERIKEKKQLLTDKEIRSILPVAGLTVCAILILAVSTDTF